MVIEHISLGNNYQLEQWLSEIQRTHTLKIHGYMKPEHDNIQILYEKTEKIPEPKTTSQHGDRFRDIEVV